MELRGCSLVDACLTRVLAALYVVTCVCFILASSLKYREYQARQLPLKNLYGLQPMHSYCVALLPVVNE